MRRARAGYEKLLTAFGLEDDGGGVFCGLIRPEEMIATDLAEAAARYLRCVSLDGSGSIYGRIRGVEEPTQKYSITMPRDIAAAARARGGPSGLSAYVAAAVARQLERDNLNDLIAVAEAEHGPITEEEVQARRETLLRARGQQHASGAGAA